MFQVPLISSLLQPHCICKKTKVQRGCVLLTTFHPAFAILGSRPQHFWHQGLFSQKIVFPQASGWLVVVVLGMVLGWFKPTSIYCVLYFYYDYISSTLDHLALDPRGWVPPGIAHFSRYTLSVLRLKGPQKWPWSTHGNLTLPLSSKRHINCYVILSQFIFGDGERKHLSSTFKAWRPGKEAVRCWRQRERGHLIWLPRVSFPQIWECLNPLIPPKAQAIFISGSQLFHKARLRVSL